MALSDPILFDQNVFQGEVDSLIKELRSLGYPEGYAAGALVVPGIIGIIGAWSISFLDRWLLRRKRQGREPKENVEVLKKAEEQATAIVSRADIRSLICPVLRRTSDDVFDISKTITPVLVGAAMSGAVSIPLDSLLFAVLALLISRVGIESICPKKRESLQIDQGQTTHNPGGRADS